METNSGNRIEAYFDNSATTPVYPEVRDLVVRLMEEDYGNPSSLHLKGVEAARYVTDAREKMARLMKVMPKEIVFTSGGTESNNMALIGGALANRRAGNKIITTEVEHASVGSPVSFLEDMGFEVVRIGVDSKGVINVDELVDAVDDNTIIVSVMYVNNEIGSVMPVQDIAKRIKEKNPAVLFHVDAIQAFGKYVIYPGRMGIDMMSVSSHKFHGPKGVGFLYARKNQDLSSFIHGGSQERGKRAGTENVAGIVGMAQALVIAAQEMPYTRGKLTRLRNYFVERVRHEIPNIRLNGHPYKRLPGNVNFSIEGIDATALLVLLEEEGICASAGSACNTGQTRISHVIEAIRVPENYAAGSVRFTMGRDTTRRDVDACVDALKRCVIILRQG